MLLYFKVEVERSLRDVTVMYDYYPLSVKRMCSLFDKLILTQRFAHFLRPIVSKCIDRSLILIRTWRRVPKKSMKENFLSSNLIHNLVFLLLPISVM